jgi:hypothetical protein
MYRLWAAMDTSRGETVEASSAPVVVKASRGPTRVNDVSDPLLEAPGTASTEASFR